jgi:hypothetical protein
MQRLDIQVITMPKEGLFQDTSSANLACIVDSIKMDELMLPQDIIADLPILSPKPLRPQSLTNCGDQSSKDKGNIC